MIPPVFLDPYAYYTGELLYEFLESYELTRAPGESFEYSNLGMGLLGNAISAYDGKTFDSMLRDRVLRPLAMNDTASAP